MEFKHQLVTPSNADFIHLACWLSRELNQITSDSGESSFNSDTYNPETDACVVVYAQKEPVACGVLRYHSADTCELKRMYSKRKGAGSFMIQQLEYTAMSKGYSHIVLSTRRINEKAVCFYQWHAYTEIEAYGKYVGVSRSICLGKALFT